LCSFRTADKSIYDSWQTLLKAKIQLISESSSNDDSKAQSSEPKTPAQNKLKGLTSPRDTPVSSSDKASDFDANGVRRTPIQFGDRNVSDAAAVDQMNLSRQIESMAEKDLWYEAKLKISEYLTLKNSMSDTALLLRRCERPCYMLKEDWPRVDPRIDPRIYSRIVALIDELSDRQQKESSTDAHLASMLEALVKYYESELSRMKDVGYMVARVPPTTLTIVAANSKRCIVSPAVLDLMDNGALQTTGHNPVRFIRDMYWKENPELPGIEFAVDLLYKKIMTKGSPPSVLVKRLRYDPVTLEPDTKLYQTSLGVEGYSLNDMDNRDPAWVSRINRSNFCFMYVMALLTLPQDGKGDNIIVTKIGEKYHLTSIDNDHSFADPVCVYRDSKKDHKHCVNVRSILFCFPQATEKFSKPVRKALLEMSPELVTVGWLEDLQKQNVLYDSLLHQNAFAKEEYENSKLPIRLRSGTAQRFYDTLKEIQRLLQPSEAITPDTIFAQLYPTCHAYYRHVAHLHLKEKASIPALFANGIFTGSAFEAYPELLDREVRYDKVGIGKASEPPSKISPSPSQMILSAALSSGAPKLSKMLEVYSTSLTDFEEKRSKLPYEELETLLQNMDLSRLKDSFETELINNLCSSMSYMHFTLIGAKLFNVSNLRSIVAHSKSLTCLELHHCPAISVQEVIEVMSIARLKAKIIISGANIDLNVDRSPLDEEATLALQLSSPLSETMLFETEKLRKSQVSPYTYMNLISEALECIRTGSYMDAKSKIEAAMKLQPKVLLIFRSEIFAVLTKDVLRNLMASPCLEFVELLLKNKLLDVNQKSSEGLSPWHMAIRSGNLDLCKLLFERGEPAFNAVTLSDQRTVLHLASLLGHIHIMDWLLGMKDPHEPLINARDYWLHTPLSLALVTRYPTSKIQNEVVERLLKARPDLSLQYDKEEGNTALHLALHYELPDIAKMLINSAAPLYIVNNSKQTVLHTAVMRNLHVDLLLERNANPNQKNAHGKTPLMVAAMHGNIPALEVLLNSSAVNVNIQDESEHTALRMAVENGNLAAIKLLIEKGKADPNLPDVVGVSPMWRAASMIYKIAVVPKPPKTPPVPSLVELPAYSEEPAPSPTKTRHRAKSVSANNQPHNVVMSSSAASSSSASQSPAHMNHKQHSIGTPVDSPASTRASLSSSDASNASTNAASTSQDTSQEIEKIIPPKSSSPPPPTDSVITLTSPRPAAQSGRLKKLPPPSLRPKDGELILPGESPITMMNEALTSPRKSSSPKKSLRPKASTASSGKSKRKSASAVRREGEKQTTLRTLVTEKQPWLACAEYLLEHKGDLKTPNMNGQSYIAYLARRIQLTRNKQGCGPREIQFLVDHDIPLDGLNGDGRNIIHLLSDMDWSQCDLWSNSGETVAVSFFNNVLKLILDSMTPAQRRSLLFQEDRSGNIPLNLGFHYGARLLDFYIQDGGIPSYVTGLSKADHEHKHPFFMSLTAPTHVPLEALLRAHRDVLTSTVIKQLKRKASSKAFVSLLESFE
jgi:ankyrin repeat protein